MRTDDLVRVRLHGRWGIDWGPPVPRMRLMIHSPDRGWVAGRDIRDERDVPRWLPRLQALLQPGESLYRVTWSEHWRLVDGSTALPRVRLLVGTPLPYLGLPRLTIERARRSFGVPLDDPGSDAESMNRQRSNRQRRRKRAGL
jgi:hypothetical protein